MKRGGPMLQGASDGRNAAFDKRTASNGNDYIDVSQGPLEALTRTVETAWD
jgi:hypothetical protein